MVKTKFKKAVSLMLAAVMSLTAFTGIGATTAFAAVGEKADVYLVDYPRSGDTNNNGEWGHGNLNYMNGWKGLSTKYTGLRAMGSYSGNIAYCIEPGTGQRTGDTLTEKDENFFNNISPNGTISGDDIRLLIGRILQYGYRGGIIIRSLNDEKTDLMNEGKSTDAVDDLIIKVGTAPKKKFKVIEKERSCESR
ncbi:thioester domain-containing protein [Dorea longicatena]|uniref:thioester domain-containing protein n=1 Tax=Dorea longicatena TaxID=88431 RepID=UPI003D743CA0